MFLKSSFKKQPHNLFIPAALLLFIISFFPGGRVIDIHLHDTMFVISMTYFFWALAIVLVLVWMIYLFTNNILLTKYLTWIHIIATLIVLIVLISAMLLEDEPRHEDITWKTIENDLRKEEIIIQTFESAPVPLHAPKLSLLMLMLEAIPWQQKQVLSLAGLHTLQY